MSNKFLQRVLPAPVYDKLRSFLFFKPNDPLNLYQVPAQKAVEGTTPVARIKGYRFPSPGSQSPASVPVRDSLDQVYNTNHYSRDFRNLPATDLLFIQTSQKPLLIDNSLPRSPLQQKRKIGKLDYDPSQLRTTKTANWAALQQTLARGNHTPRPSWVSYYQELVEERERKGLPPPVGGKLRNEAKHFYKVEA